MNVRIGSFPNGFAWGTATASYQIEGAVDEDGRTPSIWDTFDKIPGAIADGTTGERADDHYHRFREDVALMAALGVNSYRFSISWTRVMPAGRGELNAKGLAFYRALLEELRQHGIRPYVTLYHWDLPQVLEDEGGWLVRSTADAFVDYARAMVHEFKDYVSDWITLNEPWCSSFLGYAGGVHAPGKKLESESSHAAHFLLYGHGRAVVAMREIQPEARIGITINLSSVRAASDSEADKDAARRIDGLQGRFFLQPLLQGGYPADVLEDLGEAAWFAANAEADYDVLKAPLDFLGINYYTRHTLAILSSDDSRWVSNAETSDSYPGSEHVSFVDGGYDRTYRDWPVVPEGLLDALAQANSYAPELPIYITENGSCYNDIVCPDNQVDDVERTDYLQRHVAICAEAIRRGIPLRGYFVWTLMDNFEWGFGEGSRFGLIYVDYPTQVRTAKMSGKWFASFLAGDAEV